jgi:MoxR-like ATPase
MPDNNFSQSTDDTAIDIEELVHLARLAIEGKQNDVAQLARRLSRRLRRTRPELAAELTDLLEKATSLRGVGNPMRGRSADPVSPVDVDSRLDLLRIDANPQVTANPIWPRPVRYALEQMVRERRSTLALRAAGLQPSRTALLHGPPGVGKTMAERWLAREIRCPLLTVDLGTVMSSYLGRTAANLRSVTNYAKEIGGVLLLDEFDALAKRRDDAHEVGELKRLVTALLQEIDSWPSTTLLLAATNHPELLDPAAWRRFEVQIRFDVPEQAARIEAVRQFAGADQKLPSELIDALAVVFAGSVLDDRPLVDHLARMVRARVRHSGRRQRITFARELVAAGLSQRLVHSLTGVSRDTLRKYVRADTPDTTEVGSKE